jgi:hypothetical protein
MEDLSTIMNTTRRELLQASWHLLRRLHRRTPSLSLRGHRRRKIIKSSTPLNLPAVIL